MKRQQILQTIKELARSQGFYGRLYNALITAEKNQPNEYEEYMQNLESQNFKDPVDLVLYLET